MLRTVNSLDGYTIQATDDEIGKVKEVYFDDQKWGVRYVIVDTGSWLFSRKVLISPYSIIRIDDAEQKIHVQLTREQVKNSPEIDTDQLVVYWLVSLDAWYCYMAARLPDGASLIFL